MKKLSGKVHVRPATAKDYEDVMNIDRDVYEGFDYLPTLYYPFLHHPDFQLYVVEVGGKIVSET